MQNSDYIQFTERNISGKILPKRLDCKETGIVKMILNLFSEKLRLKIVCVSQNSKAIHSSF